MAKKGQDIFNWKMPTARFEALTDGVFAIVITLLVLPLIEVILFPEVNINSNETFVTFMYEYRYNFFTFFLAFFLLAIYWRTSHQHFQMIKYVDGKFYWLNILWLMFIVLLPFSTFIVGNYGELQFTVLFFYLNILVIWYFFYIHLNYLSKNTSLLRKGVEFNKISILTKVDVVIIMISLLGIGLTLLSFILPFRPSLSNIVYIFIPLGMWLVTPKKYR